MYSIFHKNHFIDYFALLILGAIFAMSSFVSQWYQDDIRVVMGQHGGLGMVTYVCVTVLAIVVAPISTMPLVPLATSIWGWRIAGLLSLLGWTIGAQFSFVIARRFGERVLRRLFPNGSVDYLGDRLSQKDIFWTLVLLRMTMPVDVLSYAIGCFTRISSFRYFLSTVIGVTPFAFVFAYAGSLPVYYQLGVLLLISLLILSILFFRSKIRYGEKRD